MVDTELILAIAGTTASVLGLIVAVIAWRTAQTAKQVAAEVRSEMQRRSAREEMEALLSDAREMSACVRAGQWFAVQRWAERILMGISVARAHRERLLDRQREIALDMVRGLLMSFETPELPVEGAEWPFSRRDAPQVATRIVDGLAGVVGYLKRLEEGGK
jgi:hypothetical protein